MKPVERDGCHLGFLLARGYLLFWVVDCALVTFSSCRQLRVCDLVFVPLFFLFANCYLRQPIPLDAMADVVAHNAALTRLGFSAKAAGFFTDDQGLDTLDELKGLTNDEIERLCKAVRRPGGIFPNPNAGDPGKPATLSKPGEQVPL